MLIKEFRVVLPMTVEEYQVGQLWSVAEASRNETGGGEGVEVLKNEPYEGVPLLNGKFNSGQYTHKIYHLASKVPGFVRFLLRLKDDALDLHEKAWNAYPYCRTELSNPSYMKDNFFIRIETMHLPDRGTTENAHELPPELLAKREVVFLDIASAAPLKADDLRPDTDPTTFKSVKTGRGPLAVGSGWQQQVQPVMTAYKLVTVEFKWWGLQGRMERYIQSVYPRMFTKFHREVFCWMDNWVELTMDDIRKLEEKTQEELDEQRKVGPVRGMTDK